MDRHGKGEREGRRGSLAERLDRHPELKARVETLLDVVEDAGDDLEKANAAEQRVIEELRHMGQDVLTGWARNQELKKSQGLRAKEAKACKKAKKTLLVHPVWENRAQRADLYSGWSPYPPLLRLSRGKLSGLFLATPEGDHGLWL